MIEKIDAAIQKIASGDSVDILALLVCLREDLALATKSRHNTNDKVVVAGTSQWRDPEVDLPVAGSKLSLLTWGSLQIVGDWGPRLKDGSYPYAAWAPLISRPPWLKERIYSRYTQEAV